MHYVRTDGKGTMVAWMVTEQQKANSGLPDRFFEALPPTPRPEHNPLSHSVSPRPPVRVDGAFVQQWDVIPLPLDKAKSRAFEALATLRWEREVGGIEVGGLPVRTDRETQASISRARQSFIEGDLQSVRWKLGDGQMITLGAVEIAGIASAVTAHVASCFDAEGAVIDALTAATDIPTLIAIDLTTEFDAAYAASMSV